MAKLDSFCIALHARASRPGALREIRAAPGEPRREEALGPCFGAHGLQGCGPRWLHLLRTSFARQRFPTSRRRARATQTDTSPAEVLKSVPEQYHLATGPLVAP